MKISLKDREKVLNILSNYSGTNQEVRRLQYKLQNTRNFTLTDYNYDYILNNHDRDPVVVNKTVKITSAYGEKLQKDWDIEFTPEKIRIHSIIGETSIIYHCMVKWRQQQTEYVSLFIPKRSILGPLFVSNWMDIEIDVDRLDKMLEPVGRKVLDHQIDAIKFLLGVKKCIYADDMGLAKEQPVSTPTPTPNGWVRMGDLKVGDKVFGSDGKECNILGVYPQGVKDVYKVSFSDGTSTECGLEHLWKVRDDNRRGRGNGWVVKTLREIVDGGLTYKKGKYRLDNNLNVENKWEIPICEPVQYTEKEYFIHPYLMGIMLGDGNLCSGGVVISIPDFENETVDRISKLLHKNYELSEDRSTTCPRYRIVKRDKTNDPHNNPNLYNQEVKRLGIDVIGHSKFIPEIYMYGSKEQRFLLLQGLMDSDGFIHNRNVKMSYDSTSLKLCEDIQKLIWSLGGKCKIFKYNKKNEYEGIKKEFTIYRVGSIQLRECPFLIKRKVGRYKPTKKISNVELIRQEESICIRVDSYDNTYLTNDYIVTHNTSASISYTILNNSSKILIICPATLKVNWKQELSFFGITDVGILNGFNPDKWDLGPKYIIVNYDIFDKLHQVAYDVVIDKETGKEKKQKSRNKKKIEELMSKNPLIQANFDTVLIDESHRLSKSTSNRYKSIDDFLKRSSVNNVKCITGTPITNSHINYFHQLKLINAEITYDYIYFMKHFCGAKKMRLKTGKEILLPKDDTNGDELRERTKHLYFRRLKSEIPGLPERQILDRYYELDTNQRKEYNRLWDEYENVQIELAKGDLGVLGGLNKELLEGGIYRQFLAMAMTPHSIELAEKHIENNQKVVIICCYDEERKMFEEHFKDRCVSFHGKMTNKAKDKSKEEFNNNPNIDVFIGNIMASGVGITLVSNVPNKPSNVLIMNSFSYVPGENSQALDRINRVGQKHDVMCYYMLFKETHNEFIWNKVLKKIMVIDNVIKDEKSK